MANAGKLREVMDVVRQNSGRWDQYSFANGRVNPEADDYKECGTSFCFAGWACVIDGLRPAYRPDSFLATGDFINPKTAIPVNPHSYAQVALGLTNRETDVLFYFWTSSLDCMADRVEEIIAGRFE